MIECKRIFDSCVSLFSYQGSCQFLTGLIFYHIVLSLSRTFLFFLEVFSSVGCCRFCDSHIRLSHLSWLVNNFFNFFQNIRKFHFQYLKSQLPVVSISLLQQLVYLITGPAVCQQLFSYFLELCQNLWNIMMFSVTYRRQLNYNITGRYWCQQ